MNKSGVVYAIVAYLNKFNVKYKVNYNGHDIAIISESFVTYIDCGETKAFIDTGNDYIYYINPNDSLDNILWYIRQIIAKVNERSKKNAEI